MLAAAVACLVGCQTSSREPGSAIPAPTAKIVDGSVERGREAVVFVNDRGSRCTGTVIGRRIVLTAKHCVQSAGASEPSAAGDLSVGVGSNVQNSSMEFFRVADVLVAPGVYTESPEEGVKDLLPNDVALLTLQHPPNVTPLEVTFEDPRGVVGEMGTAVGFGQTPGNALGGVKFTAETKIEYVDDGAIFVDATVCPGDSGGPLITPGGQVIGVVSTGIGEECGVGLGFYNRLDLHQDLIMQAYMRAGEIPGECVDTGEEICDGFDNDCDGEVDEGCLMLGTACETDAQCIGGRCDDTPMGKLCTATCDPLNPELACPDGLRCVNDGECQGFCVPGSQGGKDYGEDCKQDLECSSLLCVDPGDGRKRCLSACRSGSDGCLADEACVAAEGECGPCTWASLVSGDLGFGEPCDEDERCRSGLCIEDGTVEYCSSTCDSRADCPDSAHCRQGRCVRGMPSLLGGSCMAHSDCAAGLFCSASGREGFCTRECDDVGDCGSGFACSEVNNGSACVPQRQVQGASCSENDDCISLFCDQQTRSCSRACSQNAACGSGFQCVRRKSSPEGVCLSGDAETVTGDSGGCRVTRAPAPGAAWLWLALGLLGLWRQRRAW